MTVDLVGCMGVQQVVELIAIVSVSRLFWSLYYCNQESWVAVEKYSNDAVREVFWTGDAFDQLSFNKEAHATLSAFGNGILDEQPVLVIRPQFCYRSIWDKAMLFYTNDFKTCFHRLSLPQHKGFNLPSWYKDYISRSRPLRFPLLLDVVRLMMITISLSWVIIIQNE